MQVHHLALFTLASAATTAGSVFLVDAVSGPFFDIQSAVDASAHGDVVLVRSGTYPGFAVVSRSVAVVADTGASVTVQGGIRVRNLDADETFLGAGLNALGAPGVGNFSNGLSATSCAGSIRIQNCVLQGANGTPCMNVVDGMPAGLEARDCGDIAVSRALLVGASLPGGYWSPPTDASGPGLELHSSRVALQEVDLRGPDGGNGGGGGCIDGASGGSGAILRAGSELFSIAGTFVGGAGGNAANVPPIAYGGNGGHGLYMANTCPLPSVARTFGGTFLAGSGGDGVCTFLGCDGGNLNDGYAGAPLVIGLCASRTALQGFAPTLSCATVARESTQLALTIAGAPGTALWLRVARSTDHIWDPTRNGVQLVEASAPAPWSSIGTVGGNGLATYAYPIPTLPPSDQARVLHLQIMAVAADGTQQLGAARSVVVVDSAF